MNLETIQIPDENLEEVLEIICGARNRTKASKSFEAILFIYKPGENTNIHTPTPQDHIYYRLHRIESFLRRPMRDPTKSRCVEIVHLILMSHHGLAGSSAEPVQLAQMMNRNKLDRKTTKFSCVFMQILPPFRN